MLLVLPSSAVTLAQTTISLNSAEDFEDEEIEQSSKNKDEEDLKGKPNRVEKERERIRKRVGGRERVGEREKRYDNKSHTT